MRTLPLVLAALALALVAAGCGSSSGTTASTSTPATATGPVASAPDAKAPPPDATAPVTTPTTPAQTTTAPQGASGASHAHVPAAFVVRGGKLIPPGVSAPARVPIDVTVVARDGKAHVLLLEIPPKPRRIAVPASGRATLQLTGLRAGAYGITLDGRVAGGLVIGRGSPGP